MDSLGIVTVNGTVQGYHLNTRLGDEVLNYLEAQGTTLSPEFIDRLRSHHALQG